MVRAATSTDAEVRVSVIKGSLRGGADRKTLRHSVLDERSGGIALRYLARMPLLRLVAAKPHEPHDAEHEEEDRHPCVHPQPGDLVRGIDAHVLEEEPGEGVEHDVERERLPELETSAALDQEQDAGNDEARERLVEERRVERLVMLVLDR